MDYHSVIEFFSRPHFLLEVSATVSTVFIFSLVVLFLISFLLSGARMAYFSLTLKDINILKTRTQPSYQRIVSLLERPKTLFAVIVIANTMVNIAIILIANMLLNEWGEQFMFPVWLMIAVKIVLITLAIVIFAEILPRVWASHHKIWFASTSSMLVEYTSLLLGRMGRFVTAIDNWIESLFEVHKPANDREQQEEIDELDEADASKEEKRILKGILQFSNTTVKQTMRTRLDIVGIEITSTYPQVLEKMNTMIYSRIPVFNGNIDEIIGILHTKDLLPHLKEENDFDWQSLLRPVYFIHEQKLIEDLLQEFKSRRMHMAVVVDEFGGTAGIITLEDVIEQIVGDIQDEFDVEENLSYKVDDHTYVFDGKTMIDEACREMQIPPGTFDQLRGDSDSVAGLLLEIAGEFPDVNEELKAAGFTFKPLQITKNRILKVQVKTPVNEEKNNPNP